MYKRQSKDGTVKHVITTTGLGIGTSAPSRTLSVFDTTPIIALQNSTTGQASNDGFQLQLSSDDGYVWNYESSGHPLFGTANTERMRILSDGKVGIGTTTPAGVVGTDNVLEIAGSSNPGLVINDTGQAEKYAFHALATKLNMYYGATAFFTFDASNSNLGIRDSSP